MTIPVGTTVTWIQRDPTTHTTTSTNELTSSPDPNGIWDSGNLEEKENFSFLFNEVGTFDYFCKVHPSTMQATVTVVSRGEAEEGPQ